MKKLLALGVLGLYFCIFFSGCHTLDTLSRVNTGHVDLKDTWQAIVADDQDFRDSLW